MTARRQWDPSFTPSVPIPELRTSATGMALTMGVFANGRYQLLGGIDRYLFDHSNFLLPYLGMSTAFRAVSTWFGQETRLHLQVRDTCLPLSVYRLEKYQSWLDMLVLIRGVALHVTS